jgi:hypothetical protein
MGPVGRNNHDTITYWAPGALNEYNEAGFNAPVDFVGRWTDSNEQVRTISGVEITSRAVVHVPQDVKIGGYLAKGDQTASATPTADSMEIQAFISAPDLRNVQQTRKAYL